MSCAKWYILHDWGSWRVIDRNIFFIHQQRTCKVCGYTQVKETEF